MAQEKSKENNIHVKTDNPNSNALKNIVQEKMRNPEIIAPKVRKIFKISRHP